MSQGFTVSPVADEQGNIVDFDIDSGVNGYRSSERDYVELEDGVHHVFENVSIEEDYLEDYYTTLANSDERIPQALEWAANNLPPELITEYNQAIDNDSIDDINRLLEYILQQYPNDEYNNSDEEYAEEEELTEDESEELESVFDELMSREPGGDELAQQWQVVVQQAQDSGDETLAAVAAANAAWNAGEISAEDAFNWLTQNYNIRDLQRIYNQYER